jgi:deazaflavin-dependent oxidoreductase (nitroreductase family)
MIHGTTGKPAPRGLKRLLARLPIWLYRLRLGKLLGDRFLLLTHIGRTSGQPRQVVLEVLRHDLASHTCIIASGWGEHTDWLRNIQQNPHVLVETGARQFEAVAGRLPIEAAGDELSDYALRHPLAFRSLSKLMIGQALDNRAESCRRLAEHVPLVALRPRGEES